MAGDFQAPGASRSDHAKLTPPSAQKRQPLMLDGWFFRFGLVFADAKRTELAATEFSGSRGSAFIIDGVNMAAASLERTPCISS